MHSFFLIGFSLLLLSPMLVQAGEITANQIQRDSSGMIHAEGDVHLTSKGFDIQADKMSFNADTQAGTLEQARVEIDDKHKLGGSHLERIDLENFYGENITYTVCPEDEAWAWAILADSATLDRDEGTFRAKGARFEWGGIPIFYTPRWEHALTRRSGFLMPELANSSRRGSEVIVPYYWAAAPNWDMTFSPHWISQRGTMADVEWRHRSLLGSETLQVQSIYDQQTKEQRGRVITDMAWQFSSAIDAVLDVDAVSDGYYISDYPLRGDTLTASYLTSTASVAWREGSDSAILSTRYQQILGGASNASTLQILPRLETKQYFDIGVGKTIKLEHQSTLFSRDVGVSGLRVGVRPSWSIPWQAYNGAVSARWSVLGQYVGYQSDQFTQDTSSYGALASSLQVQAIFESISSDKKWRHEIKPILRLDVSGTKDQSDQPRYDSSLLPLSFSNLLQGNRYSGWDRFERMQRLSALLSSSLQTKDDSGLVRTVLQGQIGLVWDGLQETVDSNIAPTPTRTVSNLLVEASWMPFQKWKLTAGGQHDPDLEQWVESHASIRWSGSNQQYFNASWQRTRESYSQESEALNITVKANINQRWSTRVVSQYDLLREHMNQATVGVAYHHACWDFSFEGFKSYQIGSDSLTDIGWRFLLVFEGLGSLGES